MSAIMPNHEIQTVRPGAGQDVKRHKRCKRGETRQSFRKNQLGLTARTYAGVPLFSPSRTFSLRPACLPSFLHPSISPSHFPSQNSTRSGAWLSKDRGKLPFVILPSIFFLAAVKAETELLPRPRRDRPCRWSSKFAPTNGRQGRSDRRRMQCPLAALVNNQ